ncbi:MAG: phosphoenolpyruvate--protein phosphotransferase [Deltaproteobacteria bacterium]|nr:phosphoenolpyruvate--protein phosphotransferase [Deltaproteobacteria bacterium]
MTGRPRIFRGIGASPGVAIGTVFLLDRRKVRVPRYHIQPENVAHELERLKAAVARSVGQLEGIRQRFAGEGMEHQTILEAHAMMVRDRALFDEAAGLVTEELINAEWATSRVIERIREMFGRLSDAYFRERRGDIDFIGDRIIRNLVGQIADVADLDLPEAGTIVVAHDLSPADAAILSRQRVTAFVTEAGGKTSHTSIVARSLDVPAVVGVRGILDAAGSGDLVVVDGLEGHVLLRPTSNQVERGRKRADHYQRLNLELLEAKALPAETLDGFSVKVAGNIELPTELAAVLRRGAEGIGLYRTEFLFLGRSEAPSEEDHYRTYCRIFDEVGDQEVTIRTFDLGGEKVFGAMPTESEPNPALGLRAIRFCLKSPAVFEPQVAGLLRAAVHGRLRIMLPMVSGVEEVRAARQIIATVVRQLSRDGKPHKSDVPVGVMVEVPSAAITADYLAAESDFFSIGTNDMLQFLLAVDRTNERVDYLYLPLHPAVLRVLATCVHAATAHRIPVSVCGEMAANPLYTPIFVALGVGELSMNAASIPSVKRLIRELAKADCDELFAEVQRTTTHAEALALVTSFMHEKTSLASSPWQTGA